MSVFTRGPVACPQPRPAESLEVFLSQRQPWGSIFANVEASRFLHDLLSHHAGLDLRLNGNVEWIRDQLFLAAEDVSDEEILLERRRLASSRDWDISIGFSFQFGSIFNNVVNNRF